LATLHATPNRPLETLRVPRAIICPFPAQPSIPKSVDHPDQTSQKCAPKSREGRKAAVNALDFVDLA